jgi:hypothetical protein
MSTDLPSKISTPFPASALPPVGAALEIPHRGSILQQRSRSFHGDPAMSNASVVELETGLTLETFCRLLCTELGAGFSIARTARQPDQLLIWTPDRSCISVQKRGDELLFAAADWPVIDELGFKRSFSREISAKISFGRVILPFAEALQEERRKAATYRAVLHDVARCLSHSGFRPDDGHVVGKTLQARKPHGALDEGWTLAPTVSDTTITVQDQGAVGSVEIRYLSLDEVEAVHGFIDKLIARRRPALRLSA